MRSLPLRNSQLLQSFKFKRWIILWLEYKKLDWLPPTGICIIQSLVSRTRIYDRIITNDNLGDTVAVSRVNDAIRQMTVRSVLIHGGQCIENSSGVYYAIHWRIYFQLNLPAGSLYLRPRSIEFNSQKMQSSGLTRLFITYREYEHSTVQTTVGRFDIPIIQHGVTVQQMIDLILGRKRDQYPSQLSVGGSGCRYWCKTVTNDLEHVGLIAPGSGALLENYIRNLNQRYGNGLIPYPLYQGSFY